MAVDLTEKLGPLPYWGWIGAGVGGLALVSYWRKSHGTSTGTDTTVGSGSDSIDGLGSGTGGSGGAGAVTDLSGASRPTTNNAWSIHAADDLISHGYDPSLVESALAKYLSGQSLTTAEQSAINVALGLYGSPPEGVIAVQPGSSGGSPGTGVPGGNTEPETQPQPPTVMQPVAPAPQPEPVTYAPVLAPGTLQPYVAPPNQPPPLNSQYSLH